MATIELKVIIETESEVKGEDLHSVLNRMCYDILNADYFEETYKESVVVSTMDESIEYKNTIKDN